MWLARSLEAPTERSGTFNNKKPSIALATEGIPLSRAQKEPRVARQRASVGEFCQHLSGILNTMIQKENNFAYIDGANLYRGIKDLGWKLDYRIFHRWLFEKYGVQRAYLFIGLVPKYTDLYKSLQEAGFTLVFKEVVYDGEGKVKGNCDADLVLQAARDFYEKHCDRAILVSSDGDYASLVKFLHEHKRFKAILSPNDTCSILLKRTNVRIIYLNEKRGLLRYKEKAPGEDGTSQGSFS